MTEMPKKLKREPLLEVIWQIKFEPIPERPGGDILPGILYSKLVEKRHPNLQFHRLPMADLPFPLASSEPNLRFVVKYRMEEPDNPFLFQVGDRVITLNCRKPYSGWERFREEANFLIDIIEKSGLIPMPKTHSLRYINIFEQSILEESVDLSFLNFSLDVGTWSNIKKFPLQMRLELPDNLFTHILQIAMPTTVSLPNNETAEGVILDLETFITEVPSDWNKIEEELEQLHEQAKKLFFQKVLREEVIQKMEPEQ